MKLVKQFRPQNFLDILLQVYVAKPQEPQTKQNASFIYTREFC